MEEKKEPKIKILVACHKADPNIRQDDIYMPIQVGKALHPELDLGFQCDNTGDNISKKNGSYCELTALYWAWKNLKDIDYIGLCHYRRYFLIDQCDYRPILPIISYDYNPNENEKLKKYLQKFSIITAKPNIYPYSVAVDYARGHNSEDLRVVQKIIEEIFPNYNDSFNKAILRSNQSYPYNMFITRWKLFDEYCQFLFPLLEEVEKKTSTRDYNSYQKRLLGFLSERLWNVFIAYKKRQIGKIKELPVIWMTDIFKINPLWKEFINKTRYIMAYKISRSLNPTI